VKIKSNDQRRFGMKNNLKLILFIFVLASNHLFSQETKKSLIDEEIKKRDASGSKALVVFKKGNTFLVRDNKKSEIQPNTIIQENDVIKTENDSYVNLQLSNGVIVRIGANSQVTLNQLLRKDNKEEYNLQVSQGEVLSKVEKDKKKQIKLEIQSPTAIASVRGTEFLVESKSNSTTIAVNEGKVEVSSIDGSQKQTIEAGEKIVATFNEQKKSIMDTYEKQKFPDDSRTRKNEKTKFRKMY
jgi:Uncharacterized protein conserved in bacteria